jgi:hypothetical protein
MNSITKDWLANYKAEAERRRELLPAAKRPILAALKRAGIANLEIAYDGEGDSGQIGEITASDRDDKPVPLKGSVLLDLDGTQRSYGLTEALDAFTWEVLSLYHDGFDNNDGGFGTLSIDVHKGSFTLEHSDRVIDVCHSVTEV